MTTTIFVTDIYVYNNCTLVAGYLIMNKTTTICWACVADYATTLNIKMTLIQYSVFTGVRA